LDVIVVDQGRAVGIIDARDLLTAPPHAAAEQLMDPNPPSMRPGQDPNPAAHEMAARGITTLIVEDEDGAFLGVIPPQHMIDLLLREHDEDLARLGGYTAGRDRARSAATERVAIRLVHRLPWLVLGLLGAMGSAVLVGAFDARLEANVLVALFVPAVVYMADAVGTQTETVLIRALAAGVPVRSMARRELSSGAIVGVVIGVAFALFVIAGWGDERLAVAVGIAMLASCSIAVVLAMAIPALFNRLGQDPAFGSGPLATVAQDLLSIAVYFASVVAVGA
jgi:magnesium transporter